MSSDWYYVQEGQRVGPVDEAAILHLFRDGAIQLDTLVWQPAFTGWTPLNDAGLAIQLLPPEPPPAPAPEPEPKAEPAVVVEQPAATTRTGLHIRRTVQAAATPTAEAAPVSDPNPARAVVWPVGREPESTQVLDPEFRFDGDGKDMMKLYLKNILLTVLTLGFYRFWAQVAMKRFRYQHTTLAGGRFDYHATGKEKMIGFFKGMVILLPIAGGIFWGLHLQNPDQHPGLLFFVSLMIVLGALRPLMMVGSRRFNLSRTSWNGLRFRFDGKVGKAYQLYAKDFILTICTLGVYWTWHQVNVKRFEAENTGIGTTRFGYSGTGSELWSINFRGYFYNLITGGIYQPWWFANTYNYHLDHTTFGEAFFHSKITGASVIWNVFLATILIICTLGLAFPWVMVRYYRFFTNELNMFTDMDIETLRASVDSGASSFADGLTEAGEAIEAVGEMFT